ncbi:hypothetical protein V8C35DRAFT_148175 [Trichoderma chlorosporum]
MLAFGQRGRGGGRATLATPRAARYVLLSDTEPAAEDFFTSPDPLAQPTEKGKGAEKVPRAKPAATATVLDQGQALIDEMNREKTSKERVFKAFCKSFEETASRFTDGLELSTAKNFAKHFLSYWKDNLGAKNTAERSYAQAAKTGLPEKLHENPKRGLGSSIHATKAQPVRPRGSDAQPDKPRSSDAQRRGKPIQDHRVFIRLPKDSASRKMDSYAIRTCITDTLGATLADIPYANPIKTGWAVKLANKDIRDKILEKKDELIKSFKASTIEPPVTWYTYVVHNVRKTVSHWKNGSEDIVQAVTNEARAQTQLEPVSVRPTRRSDENSPTCSLLISFLQPTKKYWRLFGTSTPAKEVQKKLTPRQCTVCWDFHDAHGCVRSSVCFKCGNKAHEGACDRRQQCANCLGPHEPTDPKCPARPKTVNGLLRRLTRQERLQVRKACRQLYELENANPKAGGRNLAVNDRATPITPTPAPARDVDDMDTGSEEGEVTEQELPQLPTSDDPLALTPYQANSSRMPSPKRKRTDGPDNSHV